MRYVTGRSESGKRVVVVKKEGEYNGDALMIDAVESDSTQGCVLQGRRIQLTSVLVDSLNFRHRRLRISR